MIRSFSNLFPGGSVGYMPVQNGNGNGHQLEDIPPVHLVSAEDAPLPPPPAEFIAVDEENPVFIPSLEAFDFLRKVVQQAARVWPVCNERGLLAINEMESAFYDINRQPRNLYYGIKR